MSISFWEYIICSKLDHLRSSLYISNRGLCILRRNLFLGLETRTSWLQGRRSDKKSNFPRATSCKKNQISICSDWNLSNWIIRAYHRFKDVWTLILHRKSVTGNICAGPQVGLQRWSSAEKIKGGNETGNAFCGETRVRYAHLEVLQLREGRRVHRLSVSRLCSSHCRVETKQSDPFVQ